MQRGMARLLGMGDGRSAGPIWERWRAVAPDGILSRITEPEGIELGPTRRLLRAVGHRRRALVLASSDLRRADGKAHERLG